MALLMPCVVDGSMALSVQYLSSSKAIGHRPWQGSTLIAINPFDCGDLFKSSMTPGAVERDRACEEHDLGERP